MKDDPGWNEDVIAKLREKWIAPEEEEPKPRNPFEGPLADDEGGSEE